MNKSDQINELITALAKARKNIKAPAKSSENPFFKSRYADLAECLDCCFEALSDNGLVIIQMPKMSEGKIIVETLLGHSSGQWIAEELSLTPVKNDPQSCGSAITYARRYALQAFLNIAPEDDDDGNTASQKPKGEKTASEKKPSESSQDAPKSSSGKFANEAQRKRFYAIYKQHGHTDEAVKEWLLLEYGISTSKEIPLEFYDAVCKKAEYSPEDLTQYIEVLKSGDDRPF